MKNNTPDKKLGWVNEMIQREATPKPERTETVEQFCKRFGISSETYFYQARKKENQKAIIEIWLNEAVKGGNEVLHKLKDNALEGKEKSIEMYLKFILQLAEKTEANLDAKITVGWEK